MRKRLGALAAGIFLLAVCGRAEQGKVPDFPAFIFGHIVWEDESTSQSLRDLVKGYQDRQIPVSGVIIDSPWETAYNTFEFDTKRFPDYQKLIAELKGQNLAVILWITSAINTDDPDYNYALKKGYFAPGLEKYKWWKGTGGLIDYKNGEAMKFWHQRMDKALDLGIDGWKVDGIDGAIAVKSLKKRNEYAKDYYSDMFYYSREHTGKPTVVMARGIERYNEHSMSLPSWVNPLHLGIDLAYAPLEASFMTWTGDHNPNWDGIQDAWLDFKLCAEAGYLSPGFDIYGYRNGKPNKELFVRWAEWGAFVPFMENGGVPDHRPWSFGEDVLGIYRQLAVWHEELGWYFYSLVPERFASRHSLIEPQGKSYFLGDSILVAPILKPDGKVSARFPQGRWRYWFDFEKVYQQGDAIPRRFPLEEFPVYIREASLVPLWVKSPFGHHQLNSAFVSQDTFWLLPGSGEGTRGIYYPDHGRGKVSWKRDAQTVRVSAEGLETEVVLLVEGVGAGPGKIERTDRELEKSAVGKMVSFLKKTTAAGGKTLEKVDCEKLKPGGGAQYCVRGSQLFVEMNPVFGKAELEISF